MTRDLEQIIERLVGEPCSRKEVGRWKSLSLGFGDEAQRVAGPSNRAYRAWELGTYNCAWRIIKHGAVICGSRDASEPAELNDVIQTIEFGKFISVRKLSEFDVRVELDIAIVDFLLDFSDDDESFHIFCPENLYIEFSARQGWKVGPSDRPLNGEPHPFPTKDASA